jgi:hypothetical protein
MVKDHRERRTTAVRKPIGSGGAIVLYESPKGHRLHRLRQDSDRSVIDPDRNAKQDHLVLCTELRRRLFHALPFRSSREQRTSPPRAGFERRRSGPRLRLLPRRPKLRHRLFARRGGAVRHARRRRHDRGNGPAPPQLWRIEARALFEDAAYQLAIGKYVIVLVLLLAGGAGELRALKDEPAHSVVSG